MTGEPTYPAAWGPPRTKTVTWFDVQASRNGRAGISGLEYLQRLAGGEFAPPPIAMTFNMRLHEVGDGLAVFRCTPDESFLNPLGLIHGGVLCTLMDTAIGVAVQTKVPADVGYATIELKVSFLRPAPYDGTDLEARGSVLRVGRNVAFSEAHAYTADGTLVGHATSSLARLDRPTR